MKQIYNDKNTWIVRFRFVDGGLEAWTRREWRHNIELEEGTHMVI